MSSPDSSLFFQSLHQIDMPICVSRVLISSDSSLFFQSLQKIDMPIRVSRASAMVYQLLCLTPQMLCALEDGTSCMIFTLVDIYAPLSVDILLRHGEDDFFIKL